ncbi:MAG: stage III sporulation protein AE [Syntrophomonadaceae bacterium]|nr:stage III sporulation protein AE [Syntrophomonadaceae bacterium]
MVKTISLIILAAFLLLPHPGPVMAASEPVAPTFSVQDTVDSLDLEELEAFKDYMEGEPDPFLTGKSVREWLADFAKGDWKFDFGLVTETIIKFLFKEILANSNLLSKLIILAVLAALLINLQTSFASGIGRLSYLVCFLAMCALALGSFKVALGIGQRTISNMTDFMMGILPPMMALVIGLGNLNTSAILFPLLMTVATLFGNAVKNIVFPLIIMSALLSLANHLSETIRVERLARFCSQLAQITLGFLMTVFVGVLTLRSLYASVLDKVALRTTRFVTDNAIPIVGKMVGDTVEVAAGYVMMIKDALGIFAALVILAIIIFPVLKIAALGLIYKLVAAVVEPLGDVKTAAILEVMSAHLFLLMAATAAVAVMFFIMIAILVGMSTGFSMLR